MMVMTVVMVMVMVVVMPMVMIKWVTPLQMDDERAKSNDVSWLIREPKPSYNDQPSPTTDGGFGMDAPIGVRQWVTAARGIVTLTDINIISL